MMRLDMLRTSLTPTRPGGRTISRTRGGSVSLMFAGMAIPLVLGTALAVDYAFYVDAQSQLDMAADAGALHAVRVASSEFVAGVPVSQALSDGQAAGQQWASAQLATINTLYQPVNFTAAPVSFDANTGSFTEMVSYTGEVATHVGAFIQPDWNIGGTSTAVVAANSYAEFQILVDNSSSMLIGASPADIVNIEHLGVCPPTAIATSVGRQLGEYAWNYPNGVGYGKGQTVPTASPVQGSCYGNFTGNAAQCPYPQGLDGSALANGDGIGDSTPAYTGVDQYGFCPAGTGVPDTNKRIDPATKQTANVPLGPCGFACHQNQSGDYYSMVHDSKNAYMNIQLRFDVIQAAMNNVVSTILNAQKITNQFTVGVFQFNNTVNQVHPAPGGPFTEADNNLAQAKTDIVGIATPVTPDVPNTDFPSAISYLASNFTPAGNGGSAANRRKNIFIITDGMQDIQPNGGNRSIGPMTTVNPETNCSKLKALGFNIFVLYTPYYPLPNPFYLNNGPRTYVEPTVPPATTNPVIAALQACATTTSQFYQASDKNSINNALSLMVQSALASPGGFSN